ncbi:MAG: hypothetical protein EOO98_11110, partial [Pedobacter sp.]
MLAVTVAVAKPVQSELPVNISISKAKTKVKDTEVKNFNAVAAGGPLQVIITLGNTEGIRFEGDEEAISTLVTEVKGNALIIRPKMSWTSWAHKYKDKKITAHVNAKNITSLTMSGDGSITVKGTINNNSLTTTLSGSGSISATVDVQNYTAVVSGSGKLNISGESDEASATISGSGVLSKKGAFKVGSLSATISGSGSAYVQTNGEISAFISGSGKVYYTGNADVKEKKFEAYPPEASMINKLLPQGFDQRLGNMGMGGQLPMDFLNTADLQRILAHQGVDQMRELQQAYRESLMRGNHDELLQRAAAGAGGYQGGKNDMKLEETAEVNFFI